MVSKENLKNKNVKRKFEKGGKKMTCWIWDEEAIELEAAKLIEWAGRDDALVLGTHFFNRGYSQQDSSRFSFRSETYRLAKELAITAVGARREELGLKNKINAKIVLRSMACYDLEYREFLREMKMINMKKELEQDGEWIKEMYKKLVDKGVVDDVVETA